MIEFSDDSVVGDKNNLFGQRNDLQETDVSFSINCLIYIYFLKASSKTFQYLKVLYCCYYYKTDKHQE